MLDVRFFRNRRFTAANAGITMVYFAMFGSMFLTTQYLQTVLGFSALEAGIRMLPTAAFMLVVAPLAPRLVERVGTKLVVGGGLVLATIGLIGMSRVPVSNGYGHLLVAMAFMASGMGLVMAPATESIMGSLPPSKAGVGSAMNDTTRQMGGALGVAVIGSVLATFYQPGVSSRVAPLHLPADAMSTVRDSVGGAVGLARTLPGPVGQVVAEAAKTEFVDGLRIALMAAAMVVVVAAVVVFAFLPARATEAPPLVTSPEGARTSRRTRSEGAVPVDPAVLALGDSGAIRAAEVT
jgi:Na+/melibiose symporter-like transporter